MEVKYGRFLESENQVTTHVNFFKALFLDNLKNFYNMKKKYFKVLFQQNPAKNYNLKQKTNSKHI